MPTEVEMRCVTGRIGPLEEALAEELRSAQVDDPLAPVAVLVGGALMRPYLQRRMADLNDGIANVHFMMPSELAVKLGERPLVQAGRRPLPPLADRVLLQRIAAETPGYFEPVGEAPGFGAALHRLVRELRGAGFTAKELRDALSGSCEAPDKEQALATIYERFLDLRADFYGPDDCLLAADVDILPWVALHVVGVFDPSLALEKLLREIGERIPVTVQLPTTGTDADEATADFRNWLEQAGARATELEPTAADPTTLTRVATTTLAGHLEPAALDGTVRLISSPDPTREIREVARVCLAWAADGLRFHEMAIAYRHPDTYRATIEAVFQEAGIPIYLHEGSPLVERPLGRRIVSLLELTNGRLERRAVVDFITESRLPKETWERHKPNASRWDRISRDAGIVEGREQWGQRLNAAIANNERCDAEGSDTERWKRNADDARRLLAFVTELDGAIQALPATGTWGEHLKAFTSLLGTYVERADPIIDALDGLQRIDALGEAVSADTFREMVSSALENMRSDDALRGQTGAFARRGVNILDINSLRMLRFRAVAIVGLAERSFPSPPRPDPLLLDPERQSINAASAKTLPLRVLGADPEPLQFLLAIASANERLLATFPRKAQGEAKPQLPSPFFRALAEAVVGQTVSASAIDSLPAGLFTRAEGSRIGAGTTEIALSLAERDRTLIETQPALGRALLVTSSPRMEGAFDQRRARFRSDLTPHDGVVSAEVAALRERFFPDERQLSASALGNYASCPQKFLLGNFLGLDKIEEPESIISLSTLDRGSLIHHVLERFLAEEPAVGEKRIHGAGERARLLAIADEEGDLAKAQGLTGYELIWQYDEEEIREDLVRWLELEREDPAVTEMPHGDYETRFGEAWREGEPEGKLSIDQPVRIEVPGCDKPLVLGGRIDRLAWNEARTRFRVIDYKTGSASKAPKDGSLGGGGALQLPIYLHAGTLILNLKAVQGSAEYHYCTRRGDFKRRSFDGAALKSRQADLEQVLETIVGGVRGGRFQMAPEKLRNCGWCDFDTICPTARSRQIERKADDPIAAKFTAMRGIE